MKRNSYQVNKTTFEQPREMNNKESELSDSDGRNTVVEHNCENDYSFLCESVNTAFS